MALLGIALVAVRKPCRRAFAPGTYRRLYDRPIASNSGVSRQNARANMLARGRCCPRPSIIGPRVCVGTCGSMCEAKRCSPGTTLESPAHLRSETENQIACHRNLTLRTPRASSLDSASTTTVLRTQNKIFLLAMLGRVDNHACSDFHSPLVSMACI